MKTILVVEDDDAIRDGLIDALEDESFQTLAAANGDDGLRMALQTDYDLLLLDLILPGKSGLEILAELKLVKPTIPVIILSAMGDVDDRVKGLKLGADDYIVKPFVLTDLYARIEAVLRRSPERPRQVKDIAIKKGAVNLNRKMITFEDGNSVSMSDKEADILRYLAENRGRIISREELFRRVWGVEGESGRSRTIDMHIARLRDKLRHHPEAESSIVTVHGQGYRFCTLKEMA